MGRAMKRPALAVNPARPAMNPMAAMAAPTMPTMKKGGETMKSDKAQDKAMIKKAMKQHDMQEHKGGKGTKLALKDGGRIASKGEHAVQKQSKRGALVMKKGGMCKGYAKGGGIEVRGKTKGKMC